LKRFRRSWQALAIAWLTVAPLWGVPDGTIKTLADFEGTATPNGYYNLTAKNHSGAGGFRVSVTDFTPGGTYRVQYSKDGGGYLTLTSFGGGDGLATAPAAAFDIDITHSMITTTINPTNGTKIIIQVVDNIGGEPTTVITPTADGNGYSGLEDFYYDVIKPAVSNVYSDDSPGTKIIGNGITVKVYFTENVYVVTTGGTPALTLNTGTPTTTNISYTGGTTTDILNFAYTVVEDNESADLGYNSPTALALNGGTIRDVAGNDATLTLASPGQPGSLGYNEAFVIDGVKPRITNVTSTTADGSYKVGESITVTVYFDEDVTVNTGGGTPTLTLDIGTATYDPVASSGNIVGFTYAVVGGDNTSDLAYLFTNDLALNSGTIKDLSGNNAYITLPAPTGPGSLKFNKKIIVDTVDPTVSNVSSTHPDGIYTVGESIPITVSFTEAVDVTGQPRLLLNSGGIALYAGGTGNSDLTFTYSVGAGENIGNLDYTLTTALELNGGTINDAAQNVAVLTLDAPGTAGSLGFSNNLQIDTTPPTVDYVSSTEADGTKIIGQTIPITVIFTEVVYVTGTPQITMETGGIASYSAGDESTTLTFNYTVAAGDTSDDFNYASTSALAGTIKDEAGNNATLTLPATLSGNALIDRKDIILDGIVPIVTGVTAYKADGAYKGGILIPIKVAFSQPVVVSGTPTLTLETGINDAVVDYSGGSWSDSLLFNYTISQADGHTASDLEYLSINALSAGTSIKDPSGNDATRTLPALGGAFSLGGSKNIIIDTTPPTVTDVTSPTLNGTYKAGDVITIRVHFTEAVDVDVGGTPALALNSGGSASYTGGTGSDILNFSYTVGASQNTADLDYASTGALSPGVSIRDAALNDATLTLDALDPTGSLGDNKDIVIDTIEPTVTNVTATTEDGTYGVGADITIQVVFSEDVLVTGTPILALETGNLDATASYTGGTGTTTLEFSYTVAAGETSVDLDYTGTGALTGGTIADDAGNAANRTLDTPGDTESLGKNKNIKVDTTPTVTNVTSPTSNVGYYIEGNTILVTVTFDQAVWVTGTPQLALETGTLDATASYTGGPDPTNTLEFTYTVGAGEITGDLDYTDASALTLNGGTIVDVGSNPADRTLPEPGDPGSLGDNKALKVDGIVPTVTDVRSTAVDTAYTVGDNIGILIKFSEKVYVTGTPTLDLNSGGSASYTGGSGGADSTLTFTYTVGAGETTIDLEYINDPDALAGAIADTAGNAADRTLPIPGDPGSLGTNNNIVIDTADPTVTNVTSPTPGGASVYYTMGDTILVTVAFDETVWVTGTPKLILETGAADDAVLDYTSGLASSTLTFKYTVAAGHTSDDLDYIDANALKVGLLDAIEDIAGNDAGGTFTLPAPGADGSLGANKNLQVDAAIPTVTGVTSTAADTAYKAGTVIPIAVVFSEPVAVTGTPTLTLDLGSGYPVDYNGTTSGDTVFFTYTVQADQNTTDLAYTAATALALNGGAIHDVALNDADTTLATPGGANSLSANKDLVIDTIDPTVVGVTSTAINGVYNAGDTLDLTITFSEPVIVSGGPPQLTLETGAADAVADMATGSGTSILTFEYIIGATDSTEDLAYTDTTALGLNGATIIDPAGNTATLTLPSPGATGSLDDNKDLRIDTEPPSVVAVTSAKANGSYGAGVLIPITVTFTEAVTVVDTPALTLDVGGGYPLDYAGGTGTATLLFNYTVQAGHNSSGLDYTGANALALGSGSITDLVGNPAILDLPTPDSTNSLGANKDLVVDTQAPSVAAAVVNDGSGADVDSVQTKTVLAANYTGFADSLSSITLYEYKIGAAAGAGDVVNWTGNGTDTTIAATSLNLTWKQFYYVTVRATDAAGNVSDSVSSDGVRIITKPSLALSVAQNSALPVFLQFMGNDTLGMADSIRVQIGAKTYSHVDTFTFVTTYKIAAAGTLDVAVQVTGFSYAGNDTLVRSIPIILARSAYPWVAASSDGRFVVAGSAGALAEDRFMPVFDSTAFLPSEKQGAYRLGDGQYQFTKPVQVSLEPGEPVLGKGASKQAIYILRPGGRWEELPSVDDGPRITTWSLKAGAFKLGRRTIIVPEATSLRQNYPNPFNPSTTIVFDLGYQDGPSQQQARVVIYDLLGRTVTTLFDGVAWAGHYEVVWRGLDAQGIPVSSGIYFVRLTTRTGHKAVKKMVLVR